MQLESNSLGGVKGKAIKTGIGIDDAEIEQMRKGEKTITKMGTSATGKKTQTTVVV